MSRHHEWYRDQWHELLGKPEYRWRWYNNRWQGLQQGEHNPRLWPALELAVRSGLLGPTGPYDHPHFDLELLHAFNRKVHGNFVRSIAFLWSIAPYSALFRLDLPLGTNGDELNGASSHAVTDRNGGTAMYTRFEAKNNYEASLDQVAHVLEFHDAFERKIAPYFFAWLTDYKSTRFEDLQHPLVIGKAGADYLRVCEAVSVPTCEITGVANVIAKYSSFRDDFIDDERAAWRDFERNLLELNQDRSMDPTWPSDTVEKLLTFASEHQATLGEAMQVRRDAYAQYRRESEEALSSLEESAGISIGEEYE
jgi:hypothetical protein